MTSCSNATEAAMYCGVGSLGDWRTTSCSGGSSQNTANSPSPSPSYNDGLCYADGAIEVNGQIKPDGSCGGAGQRCPNGMCCSLSGFCGPAPGSSFTSFCGTGMFGQNLGDWRRVNCTGYVANITEFKLNVQPGTVAVQSVVKLDGLTVPSGSRAHWGPQSVFATYANKFQNAGVEYFQLTSVAHWHILMITMDPSGSPIIKYAVEILTENDRVNVTRARARDITAFKDVLLNKAVIFDSISAVEDVTLLLPPSPSPSPSPSFNHCYANVRQDMKCDGKFNGCPLGYCCMSTLTCQWANMGVCPTGSIADYTMCVSRSLTPSPSPSNDMACNRPDYCKTSVTTNGKCGTGASGRCPDGTCCSASGWCGPSERPASQASYDEFCGKDSQGDSRMCSCAYLIDLCTKTVSAAGWCGIWATTVRCPDSKPCCNQGSQCEALGANGKCDNPLQDYSFCAKL